MSTNAIRSARNRAAQSLSAFAGDVSAFPVEGFGSFAGRVIDDEAFYRIYGSRVPASDPERRTRAPGARIRQKGYVAMQRVIRARRRGDTATTPVNPHHGGWQAAAFARGMEAARTHSACPPCATKRLTVDRAAGFGAAGRRRPPPGVEWVEKDGSWAVAYGLALRHDPLGYVTAIETWIRDPKGQIHYRRGKLPGGGIPWGASLNWKGRQIHVPLSRYDSDNPGFGGKNWQDHWDEGRAAGLTLSWRDRAAIREKWGVPAGFFRARIDRGRALKGWQGEAWEQGFQRGSLRATSVFPTTEEIYGPGTFGGAITTWWVDLNENIEAMKLWEAVARKASMLNDAKAYQTARFHVLFYRREARAAYRNYQAAGGKKAKPAFGARLTAAERRALPASDFVFPKRRAYPINDRGHAVAARGRAVQQYNAGNLTHAGLRKVWRATTERYDMSPHTIPLADERELFGGFGGRGANNKVERRLGFGGRADPGAHDEKAAQRWRYNEAISRGRRDAAIRQNMIMFPNWSDAEHASAIDRDLRRIYARRTHPGSCAQAHPGRTHAQWERAASRRRR